MKLVRTVFLLATGMAIAGFVQAESASIYMHFKKGNRHAHRPQAVTSVQADAGNVVIRSNPEIAMADDSVSAAANSIDVASAQHSAATNAAASEKQPIDTILPKNSRIVQGDDLKNEFYILAEGEQDPVKPIDVSLRQHQMAVDTQLKRVDTRESMWAISKPSHVDVILSQIAHNATVSEQHMNIASAQKQTSAAPLFRAEKNGDVVDVEVALDKVFAEVDANNAVPLAVVPAHSVGKQVLNQVRATKKVSAKKRTVQRVLTQRAPAKTMKAAVKKLTQKKIKPARYALIKHKVKSVKIAQHVKKSGMKLVSKHKRMPLMVMHKQLHKLAAVHKKSAHHLLVMNHKSQKQHVAMIRHAHAIVRRHAMIHVNA